MITILLQVCLPCPHPLVGVSLAIILHHVQLSCKVCLSIVGGLLLVIVLSFLARCDAIVSFITSLWKVMELKQGIEIMEEDAFNIASRLSNIMPSQRQHVTHFRGWSSSLLITSIHNKKKSWYFDVKCSMIHYLSHFLAYEASLSIFLKANAYTNPCILFRTYPLQSHPEFLLL